MVRNILIAVIVCVLLYLGYFAFKTRSDKASVNGGEFSCQGCDSPEQHARFLKENSGDAADGDTERKASPARVATDQPAPASAPRAFGSDATAAAGTSSMVEPSAPVVVPTTAEPGATVAGLSPMGLPTTDTVSPNPVNGMTFTGKGSYQWYRQGNLTWRVDTTSGRSCIIYATMEEWRKQIVMSHGCGRTA